MMEKYLKTPVAFIIFKRPDTTKKVFEEIAKAKPKRLFVIADGPRKDRPGEAEKCAAVRAIVDRVDWECEVLKNYSDVNLGCGHRVASGISWVFEHVDRAIILEDDCVPHPTFFRFCDELLEAFLVDERVMMISGHNPFFEFRNTSYSYSFSRLGMAWGWATWARAWKYHDMKMELWPLLRNTPLLLDVFENPRFLKVWNDIFDLAYTGAGSDTWDHQWLWAIWAQNGLGIMPTVNLVANIGFGKDATHTLSQENWKLSAFLPAEEMRFPLKNPPYMIRDRKYDYFAFEKIVTELEGGKKYPSLTQRVRRKLHKIILGKIPLR
jgi:hypothetical protein